MGNSLLDTLYDVVEKSFNVNDGSIGKSITSMTDWLNSYSKLIKPNKQLISAIERNEEKSKIISSQRAEENRLRKELAQLRVRDERDILDRVDDITEYIARQVNNFGVLDIKHIYKMSDDLVNDLEATRDWMQHFKKYVSSLRNNTVNNMQLLIALGKAILGKAVELAPYKTGLLRKSGILLVYSDYIEIVFTAPYATYVHENMENYHKYGRAKFLELALQEFFPNKSVWVEITGESIVYARISINYDVLYKHYNG